MPPSVNPQSLALAGHADSVARAMRGWESEHGTRRLWEKDSSLWTGGDESRWLGWLHVVDQELGRLRDLEELGREVSEGRFENAVVLGMGGSSLAADVLARSLGPREGFPHLYVLDSTVPAQIAELQGKLSTGRTIFVVASKSGTTAEPNAFESYFYEESGFGESFIAVTDPGSALERLAKEKHYRRILHGEPEIGGRFSALSRFGLAPAALLGVDLKDFLERARAMVETSRLAAEDNPAVALGVALGTLAREGRDKLTLSTSPELASFGGWLEQLLAESTGKDGKGIVPVDREAIGGPGVYGDDRFFVHVGIGRSDFLEPLERAGYPVIRIVLGSAADLAQEFFRWEVATAVAGSVMELDPFDQPDVEASKLATRRLMARFEESGELPEDEPDWEGDGLALFTDPWNRESLELPRDASPEDVLRAHLGRLEPGDYFAVNAFVAMSAENDAELSALRHDIRDRRRVATTLGYGPRFLHSTGQLHKGGPNRGVFLHVTSDDAKDLQIPGKRTSFGNMKAFQAAGDLEVLLSRGRRALRVHLGADVAAGLRRLRSITTKS